MKVIEETKWYSGEFIPGERLVIKRAFKTEDAMWHEYIVPDKFIGCNREKAFELLKLYEDYKQGILNG